MKTYDLWLQKTRRRARISGTLSEWSRLLAEKDGGDAELWREHLQAILDEEEKAPIDLILALDQFTPTIQNRNPDAGQEFLF